MSKFDSFYYNADRYSDPTMGAALVAIFKEEQRQLRQIRQEQYWKKQHVAMPKSVVKPESAPEQKKTKHKKQYIIITAKPKLPKHIVFSEFTDDDILFIDYLSEYIKEVCTNTQEKPLKFADKTYLTKFLKGYLYCVDHPDNVREITNRLSKILNLHEKTLLQMLKDNRSLTNKIIICYKQFLKKKNFRWPDSIPMIEGITISKYPSLKEVQKAHAENNTEPYWISNKKAISHWYANRKIKPIPPATGMSTAETNIYDILTQPKKKQQN